MTITVASKDERSIGMAGWLTIPAAEYSNALATQFPMSVQQNMKPAIESAIRRNDRAVMVPLMTSQEYTAVAQLV